MTINVANTTLTNTFEYLVNRTNELSNALTTKVVTADSNTTSGNAAITGTFSANVYIVGNSASNTSISAPNTEQKSSGEYFLNANGSWSRASPLANSGIIANSSGVFVNANTGIVVNTAGVFVDSVYIGTLTSNNATRLGGTLAASYVQNTDSRTLSGNLVFSGANTNFTGANVKFTGASLSDVTVVSGTWGGTPIALDKGGTGATTDSGARTALGLGTMATQSGSAVTITGGSITGITDLAIADGGTGSSTAAGALVNLGLTATAAELNRMNGISVSTAELNTLSNIASNIQTQLGTKAPTASPTFTGTVATSSFNLGGNIVTDIATQSQAEAGSLHSVVMTPLRTKQAIAASTSEVLTATASGAWTGVGTYGILGDNGTSTSPGATRAGSGLNPASWYDEGGSTFMGMTLTTGTTMPGTWRLMGGGFSSSRDRTIGLFLRIS
jgi:hypothetical protein